MTCNSDIAAWWSSLRIPAVYRYDVREADMGRYARLCGRCENSSEIAHHINAIAMWSHKDCPGDPWPGFKKLVDTFFKDKENEMAKKGAAAKPVSNGNGYDEEFDVKFNSVNFTKQATVGIAIDAKSKDAGRLHKIFVGSQLQVQMVTDPNAGSDAPGQGKLIEGAEVIVEGVAETKRLGFSSGHASTTLVFPLGAIDRGNLSRFGSSKGKVRVKRLGDAAKAQVAADGMEGGDEDEE